MPRPTIVLALPAAEAEPVSTELAAAGFPTISVEDADQLEGLLAERRDVALAVLDGETDFDLALELYSILRDRERPVAALMVVSPRSFERLAGAGGAAEEDEFLTRPYSAEALRWRVEAMCIRSVTFDDGSGDPVLAGGLGAAFDWTSLATVFVVFNPKGGVGKTTIATNVAAAVQAAGDRRVLLLDADTVTGHILTSLGLEAVPTLADAWRDEADGGPIQPIAELAATHPSGMRVLALTSSPIHTDLLEPDRVVLAVDAARRAFDVIVIDLHPSYSPLNRAIFELADRILMPVTPDVPAVRATVQFRDVATDLGINERLALIVNRANSGVSLDDIERTVGLSVFGQVRSGGMTFVTAANEGKTVIERFPKEKVTGDFETLAKRLFASVPRSVEGDQKTKPERRLLGRKLPVIA